MKKLTLITVLALALTVSGCEAIFGSPETPTPIATYTPAPTYTPLPTYTPFPSPTQPPEPSATLVPLASPTVFGVTPTDAGAGASGTTATVLNSSFVREGPGLYYKPVSHVDAGETVLVLGRDHEGFWLKIRNSAGQEGWVRLTQFVQPIDVRQIPESKDIPTPSVTVTVKPGTSATKAPVTGTPGTQTAPTTSSGLNFNLTHGGGQVCSLVSPWYVAQAVAFKDWTVGILPYKPGDGSQIGTTVFMVDTSQLPSGITASIQGNILGNSCTSACNLLTFTLCASASASVAPGRYDKPVILEFGPYDVSTFNSSSVSGVPTVFTVN